MVGFVAYLCVTFNTINLAMALTQNSRSFLLRLIQVKVEFCLSRLKDSWKLGR